MQKPGNSCPGPEQSRRAARGRRERKGRPRRGHPRPGGPKPRVSGLTEQPPSREAGHSLQNPRRVTEKPLLARDSAWCSHAGLRPTSPSTDSNVAGRAPPPPGASTPPAAAAAGTGTASAGPRRRRPSWRAGARHVTALPAGRGSQCGSRGTEPP